MGQEPVIIRRPVRQVRLTVKTDASVELVVPFWYTPWDVREVLAARAWTETLVAEGRRPTDSRKTLRDPH